MESSIVCFFEDRNIELHHRFLKKEELDFIPKIEEVNLCDGRIQQDVDEGMRRILIDWLTDVVEEYKIHTSTLFLSIHILDRVLLKLHVKKADIQLMGCACLLLAGKIEEISPPAVDALVYISDYCFDSDKLISAEQKILVLLDFKVFAPTRYYFASQLARVAEFNSKEICFTNFLLECSLQDISLNTFPASMVAAAAIHVTVQILRFSDTTIWTSALRNFSGYEEFDIVHVVMRLRDVLWKANEVSFKNTVKKYDDRSLHHVSTTVPVLRFEDLRFDTCTIKNRVLIWRDSPPPNCRLVSPAGGLESTIPALTFEVMKPEQGPRPESTPAVTKSSEASAPIAETVTTAGRTAVAAVATAATATSASATTATNGSKSISLSAFCGDLKSTPALKMSFSRDSLDDHLDPIAGNISLGIEDEERELPLKQEHRIDQSVGVTASGAGSGVVGSSMSGFTESSGRNAKSSNTSVLSTTSNAGRGALKTEGYGVGHAPGPGPPDSLATRSASVESIIAASKAAAPKAVAKLNGPTKRKPFGECVPFASDTATGGGRGNGCARVKGDHAMASTSQICLSSTMAMDASVEETSIADRRERGELPLLRPVPTLGDGKNAHDAPDDLDGNNSAAQLPQLQEKKRSKLQ